MPQVFNSETERKKKKKKGMTFSVLFAKISLPPPQFYFKEDWKHGGHSVSSKFFSWSDTSPERRIHKPTITILLPLKF